MESVVFSMRVLHECAGCARSFSPEAVSIGEIRLGELSSRFEIDYYSLKGNRSQDRVGIALYGHITHHDAIEPLYLRSPLLILEKRTTEAVDAPWIEVDRVAPSLKDTHIARIQNVALHSNFEYRIGVSTTQPRAGKYALILDKSPPGYELEVEDLDFGVDSFGRPHVVSSAHVGVDPESPYGARIVVGTEGGYLLESVDDAQSWRQIYPPPDGQPFRSVVFGVFVDSERNIYASPWTSEDVVVVFHAQGRVIESRDNGVTWREALEFEWPVGVAWRFAEDRAGNVLIGEYTANSTHPDDPCWTGNVWRRKNHGNGGEVFEIVYRNPIGNPSTKLNHVHFVGVDPYTDDLYATIGDGDDGRFVCSTDNGDPGSWQTLERGVGAQYTAMAFTPDFLFLGQDTNRAYKKIVRWDKRKTWVDADEPFWTSTGMDCLPGAPVPWADKGNWYWGHYLDEPRMLLFQYLPYGLEPMPNGQMQSPRLYASVDAGERWWRALTFPPVPGGENARFGFYGPKHASNVGPNGWIYATPGTIDSSIHRGFRFRHKRTARSRVTESMDYE